MMADASRLGSSLKRWLSCGRGSAQPLARRKPSVVPAAAASMPLTKGDFVLSACRVPAVSGTLVSGLVGLVGLGRTAYKLAQGDTDSMTALIFAIVGIVLGFLANTFLTA